MLHSRDDFSDLLTTVGESTGAGAAIIEKDYWVTEALRVVAAGFNGESVFKGGTSLSKAWGLIRRFSEDVDLLIRTTNEELASGGARDRYMKGIADAVGDIDGLSRRTIGSRSERGVSRTAVFEYESQVAALEGLTATVMLEMGIRGGPYPSTFRPIRSMLSSALSQTEVEDPTLAGFKMATLDPSRTFVEKLFAINSACVLFSEGGTTAIQRRGRHFYDLYFLLEDTSVNDFIGGDGYRTLVTEVDAFGREWFERDHRSPPELTFENSPAINPDEELRDALQEDYSRSAFLFYGDQPSFGTILERLQSVRDRL
jgi:hypothetical protein